MRNTPKRMMLTLGFAAGAVFSTVLVATCNTDPGGPGTDGAVARADQHGSPGINGSRLKQQVIVGADGSQLQAQIWDSQRKEVCAFQMAEDGKLRCLPVGPWGGPWQGPSGFFSDAACALPVFALEPASCPPPYGRDPKVGNACGSGRLYRLTKYNPSTIYLLDKGTGKCGSTTPAGANYEWYQGSPVTPSEFVAGDPTNP